MTEHPQFMFFEDVITELRWWAEHFHKWSSNEHIGDQCEHEAGVIEEFLEEIAKTSPGI
jgi:hypothetical protein